MSRGILLFSLMRGGIVKAPPPDAIVERSDSKLKEMEQLLLLFECKFPRFEEVRADKFRYRIVVTEGSVSRAITPSRRTPLSESTPKATS